MRALALAAAGFDDAHSADPAAFETLLRQYERQVLMTALRLLGNLEDAQDASQEVFLRSATPALQARPRPSS